MCARACAYTHYVGVCGWRYTYIYVCMYVFVCVHNVVVCICVRKYILDGVCVYLDI